MIKFIFFSIFSTLSIEATENVCDYPQRFSCVLLDAITFQFFETQIDSKNKLSKFTVVGSDENDFLVFDYNYTPTRVYTFFKGSCIWSTPSIGTHIRRYIGPDPILNEQVQINGEMVYSDTFTQESAVNKDCHNKFLFVYNKTDKKPIISDTYFNFQLETGDLFFNFTGCEEKRPEGEEKKPEGKRGTPSGDKKVSEGEEKKHEGKRIKHDGVRKVSEWEKKKPEGKRGKPDEVKEGSEGEEKGSEGE